MTPSELRLKKLELIASFDPEEMTAVEMFREFKKTYTTTLHAFYKLRREVFGNIKKGTVKGSRLKELDFGTKMRKCIMCGGTFETPIDKNGCSLKHRCEDCYQEVKRMRVQKSNRVVL